MRLDEIRKRLEAARRMIHCLCAPRGTAEHVDWLMSIPARPDVDPDLVISAALHDTNYLLARVEKLEGLLTRLVAAGVQTKTWEDFGLHAARVADEARTLLAGEESKDDN